MDGDDVACFKDCLSLATGMLCQKRYSYKKQCGEPAPQGASPCSQSIRENTMDERTGLRMVDLTLIAETRCLGPSAPHESVDGTVGSTVDNGFMN